MASKAGKGLSSIYFLRAHINSNAVSESEEYVRTFVIMMLTQEKEKGRGKQIYNHTLATKALLQLPTRGEAKHALSIRPSTQATPEFACHSRRWRMSLRL